MPQNRWLLFSLCRHEEDESQGHDYTDFFLAKKEEYVPPLDIYIGTDFTIKLIAVYDKITMSILHAYKRKPQTYLWNPKELRYEAQS